MNLKHVSSETSRHGKKVYYYRRQGKRVRLPDKPGTPKFLEAYDKASGREISPSLVFHVQDYLLRAIPRTKRRAAKKGVEHNITKEWIVDQIEKQRYRCALTGIEFFSGESIAQPHSYGPSIDRIDNARGYTTDNVRIILHILNVAIGPHGEEKFAEVAEAFLRVRQS